MVGGWVGWGEGGGWWWWEMVVVVGAYTHQRCTRLGVMPQYGTLVVAHLWWGWV